MLFKLLSSAELGVLCLVNRHLRALAEPFLYSEIQWTWLETDPHPLPITQLLRTILCRPELAAYITSVHLNGRNDKRRGYQSTNRTTPTIPVFGTELDESITFIRGTRVPYSDQWIQELRSGTMDAVVALLLAQLPNLRCLHLENDFTQRSALLGMVLRSSICEPVDYRLPSFQHLRDVSFFRLHYGGHGGDQEKYKSFKNTADILPFFYLPSVQCMSVLLENPLAFSWPAAHLPTPSTLTLLDLTSVREAYLAELLSVTQNLKTLRWSWYYDFGLDDKFNTPIIDLGQIAAAIAHVRDTLTDLTISADCDIGGNDQHLPGLKTVGSLHAIVNCDMLQRLQVPWPFLVGFAQNTTKRLQDVIPRNIEYLSITDDLRLQNDDSVVREWPPWEWEDSVIVSLLQSWLDDWENCTPYLRGISLVFSFIFDELDEWCPSMRHRLRALGAQAGVQVELIDLTDNTPFVL